MTRHHHRKGLGLRLSNLRNQLESIHLWHFQIRRKQIEGVFLHFSERIFSRLRKFHLKSSQAGEGLAEKAPDFFFIIHD